MGSGDSARTLEVGAVEWNAQVTAPPTTNELYFLRGPRAQRTGLRRGTT